MRAHRNPNTDTVWQALPLALVGQTTTAATFQPFAVYLTVAALYFALCFPLTEWSRRLERRLHGAR